MPATPHIWGMLRPAAQSRRVCAGIPANARATSAISPAPVREPPRRTNAYRPRQGPLPPATRVRTAPRHATSRARPWRSAATRAAAATTRHRRRSAPSPACVRRYAGHRQRLLAGTRRTRSWGCFKRESEAGLVPFSADDLTGNHFKMALVLAVSAADIAAIKPNNDRLGWRHRHASVVVVTCGCTTASPTRRGIVLFRTVPAFSAPQIGSNS